MEGTLCLAVCSKHTLWRLGSYLYAASHAGLMLGRGVTVPLMRKSCHSLTRPGKLLKK